VADALTGPLLIAAGLLVVSGLAKLMAPAAATRALAVAGLPGSPALVRMLSAVETALGVAALTSSETMTAAGLAVVYAGFAGFAMLLTRRRAACGCFGDSEAPASRAQAILSAVVASVCTLAVFRPAHDLDWVLAQKPVTSATLLVGSAACVYAVVLVYTQLPAAWTVWSGR
jgi:hypothetical protein